jgi:hypothetical protein
VPNNILSELFEVFWPRLESELSDLLTKSADGRVVHRAAEDYLEEILGLLRGANIKQQGKTTREVSIENVLNALGSEIESLNTTIFSMEEYERNGGGASSEIWWDSYVERHRKVRSLYKQALDLLESAREISLNSS